MPYWARETSIPYEVGFSGPTTQALMGCKQNRREGCAGTHVAGEVVEAQHHDEDHHCHRVLRRHQGQPAGQRVIQLKAPRLLS